MSAYLRDEVLHFSVNYLRYAQKWRDRFQDLRVAYATGLKDFTDNMPKARGGLQLPQGLLEDSFGLIANIIVAGEALSGTPLIVSIPIVYGIKKLGGLLDTE